MTTLPDSVRLDILLASLAPYSDILREAADCYLAAKQRDYFTDSSNQCYLCNCFKSALLAAGLSDLTAMDLREALGELIKAASGSTADTLIPALMHGSPSIDNEDLEAQNVRFMFAHFIAEWLDEEAAI